MQEKGEAREEIRRNPPDILLTNYMMLELLLTRIEDRELVRAAQGLRFLVFDKLHTYRGRQGADVAMLIRRCRHAFGNDIVCVGTSATMASGGGSEDERLEVAKVSQSLFGVDFTPEQIVTETLERATPAIDTADATIQGAIRAAVASDDGPPTDYEARFRDGDLPLLFCSPTMELGVDIAQLNLVNLRNVPPTPANYAQRSGRAGRGGQPALVFTYCAGRSPHDQYFYRDPTRMVAGVVAPPRIDLRNRDLIRTHVHAIWMEAARPDLGRTLTAVLDLDPDHDADPREDDRLRLPVKAAVAGELRNPVHRAVARARADAVIAELRPDLERTAWFHDGWVDEVLGRVERSFDAACDRWRGLYRAAVRQRKLHHDIIGDHSRPEAERNHSRRLRAQRQPGTCCKCCRHCRVIA